MTETAPTLVVEGLDVSVGNSGARVVKGLSFTLPRGGALALVGESGSGKTMAARSVLQLLPPPLWVSSGSIRFEGRELTTTPEAELRRIRGARIGMVFQEPMVSLNPSMTIGEQMAEALRLHRRLGRAEIRSAAAGSNLPPQLFSEIATRTLDGAPYID